MSDYRIPIEIWHEIFEDLLRVDFRELTHDLSYSWRDRIRSCDLMERHVECWNRQGPLRLVSRRWKALVETYPCTWLHLRVQGITKRQKALSVHPITSSYTCFHLAQRTTDFIGASDMNRITTLSISVRNPFQISSIKGAIDSLPTMPRLRALHIALPLITDEGSRAMSSIILQLLRSVECSLISLYLTTEARINLRGDPPINLPKLQHFGLESTVCYLTYIGVECWQLPSLQHLSASLLGARYTQNELAPAFGAQLISFSSPFLRRQSFWGNYPALTSLHARNALSSFVMPPIDHPIRELALSWDEIYSPYALQMLLREFLGVTNQYSQVSSPTSTASNRKVVLVGLKWTDDDELVGTMTFPITGWEAVAPYVEDELGETLASAKARLTRGNTERSGSR